MQLSNLKNARLSGNALKIIAAVLMVIDHVGVMFFPDVVWLRALGRLSFPIFAFMIAEGARYTKNKIKYFLLIFSLAAVCQTVYYFFDGGSLYMCILVSFSISLLLIYLLDALKRSVFSEKSIYIKILLAIAFAASISAVYFINTNTFIQRTGIMIDYGFGGIMLPVFASLLSFRGIDAPGNVKAFDTVPARVLCMTAGLVLLSVELISSTPGFRYIQFYSLLAVPLLLLYSGERGRLKMKYFFYLFYPLHLVALYAIYALYMLSK